MKQGHVRQLAEEAFTGLKIAEENRRLEFCLSIKTVIAQKLNEPTEVKLRPGQIWLPGGIVPCRANA